jgi:hypothetical protein
VSNFRGPLLDGLAVGIQTIRCPSEIEPALALAIDEKTADQPDWFKRWSDAR